MLPLEKVALAIRVAGFPKFASAYVRACGEEAPDVWDLAGSASHIGTKLAAQAIVEGEVQAGVKAAAAFGDVKVATDRASFTAEFHAVNRLAAGLDKTASAEAIGNLSARRLALWGSMKAAAERTPDVLSGLAKIALLVWSETNRSGEKTASTRAEREAYALSFAANYLVDTKIASAYEAKEISLSDAIKLSHLSAEAALEDLTGVVKTCRGHDGSVKHAGFFNWFKKKPHANKPDPAEFTFDHNRMALHAPGAALYPAEDDDSGDLGYFTHDAHPGVKSWVSLGGLMDDVSIRGSDVYKDIHKHFTDGSPLPNGVDADELKLYKKQAAIDPRLIGAGIGAGIGATAGAVSDKDNRWRGAGMGALMGMPVGALGGQVVRELGQNAAAGAEKARRGQDAFDKLKIYAGHMGSAGNNLPGALDKNKDALVSSFGDGKRVIPTSLMEALGPNDFEQLLKLDRSYGGTVFGKTSMFGGAPAQGASAAQPAPQAQGGQGVPLNPEAVRKGTAGYQQLVSYGQTIGNGLPELIEQNKDAVIQHFAEGNKHMPPQITAAMGPGIIDQVLQLKKQFQAPVI